MNFLLTFARRPVLASVVGLVILLLGLQALVSLQVRQYPETTSTTINVATPYIGANAELVRGFITTPLEAAIATPDGIEYMESSSSQGVSLITARLVLGTDPNEATAQILIKIKQVANQLPPEAENCVLSVTTGEERAAMYLAFTSNVLTPSEIPDHLNRAARPRLQTAEGVQQAGVQGATPLAMRIWLDPQRMAALGVTPGQVRQALASQNTLAAVGDTKGSTLVISFQADTPPAGRA